MNSADPPGNDPRLHYGAAAPHFRTWYDGSDIELRMEADEHELLEAFAEGWLAAVAAAPVIAAQAARDERQAIVDLADEKQALWFEKVITDGTATFWTRDFADLLRGAEMTGDKQ